MPIVGSGRTDSGVHATGQIFHCDIPTLSKSLTLEKLNLALNNLLPNDIKIQNIKKTKPDFHARFHAKSKIYTYTILLNKFPNPLIANTTLFQNSKIFNLENFAKNLQSFVGTHDFSNFSCTKKNISKIRTIKSIKIKLKKNNIHVHVHGNGFLHKMVRIIIGTAMKNSNDKLANLKIANSLNMNKINKSLITYCAKPYGLCLKKVFYKKSEHF